MGRGETRYRAHRPKTPDPRCATPAAADPDTGRLIFDAELAFTAFASTNTAGTVRLIVRRVRNRRNRGIVPGLAPQPLRHQQPRVDTDEDITHRRHPSSEPSTAPDRRAALWQGRPGVSPPTARERFASRPATTCSRRKHPDRRQALARGAGPAPPRGARPARLACRARRARRRVLPLPAHCPGAGHRATLGIAATGPPAPT